MPKRKEVQNRTKGNTRVRCFLFALSVCVFVVIFDQGVHSIKLIFSGARTNIQYIEQIFKNKHAYKTHNKRNEAKSTMNSLNNKFEKTTNRQLLALDC